MTTWDDFEKADPAMASAGRTLLYQFKVPLGYLATVRPDGGPRLHPMCPILMEQRLYALIIDSPKRADLLRDGRYALHTFPAIDRDDEFYLTGRAIHHPDPSLTERVRTAFLATGAHSTGDEMLFELGIEHVMLATYKPRAEAPTAPPTFKKWHAK